MECNCEPLEPETQAANPNEGLTTMNLKTVDRTREIGARGPQFYEVFARKTSADPLTHVGSVEAPNDELAEVRAWYVFDEHKWRELCVVPAAAIIPVTERGRRVKIKEV